MKTLYLVSKMMMSNSRYTKRMKRVKIKFLIYKFKFNTLLNDYTIMAKSLHEDLEIWNYFAWPDVAFEGRHTWDN